MLIISYVAFGIAWMACFISMQHIKRFKKIEKEIEELKQVVTISKKEE